jgi:4-methylaminobutanoate oxidase (formaldehyde-forming)
VNADYLASAKWEIEIAGSTYPAEVSLKPMYDPENKKIKA